MQFKSMLFAGIAGSTMVLAAATQAATLDSINGGIFVSKGAGYQAVNAPVYLNPGDSILANPGSSARVVFNDGCMVAIRPGTVFTVPETAPCTAGPPPSTGYEVSWPIVVGGVAVAGGIGIAIAASGGGDDPASP